MRISDTPSAEPFSMLKWLIFQREREKERVKCQKAFIMYTTLNGISPDCIQTIINTLTSNINDRELRSSKITGSLDCLRRKKSREKKDRKDSRERRAELKLTDSNKNIVTKQIAGYCIFSVKRCPSDPINFIPDGTAMTSKQAFFYGDRVDFICNIGMVVKDSAKAIGAVTCESDGQWNTRPSCESKHTLYSVKA